MVMQYRVGKKPNVDLTVGMHTSHNQMSKGLQLYLDAKWNQIIDEMARTKGVRREVILAQDLDEVATKFHPDFIRITEKVKSKLIQESVQTSARNAEANVNNLFGNLKGMDDADMINAVKKILDN